MKHKGLHILISITLMLCLASVGMCTLVPPLAWKSACQKDKIKGNGIGTAGSQSCKVHPCKAAKASGYILPDSSARAGSEPKKRTAGKASYSPINLTIAVAFSGAGMLQAVLKSSLSDHLPPLFTLHCILLC